MPSPRTRRHTIGQLMTVIAVLAGLLAVPRLVRSPDRLVGVAVLGILVTFALSDVLVAMVFGRACPSCSRRELRRLARNRHYYRCSACRARFKRFGYGPWLDASGAEDADRYRGRAEAGTWKGYAAPEELEGSTSGQLLRGKRSRDPLGEVRRSPPRLGAGRRLEEAARKVRKFLKNRQAVEE
jgi:ribosomal protein L37AE/L43A